MNFRLPWVSREHHTETVALWRRIADSEHENAQALRREIAALLAPKAVTFSVADGAPVSVVRPEPSAVSKIIREQSETAGGQTDHALARHLRSYAKKLKDEGKTEDQIVAALVEWQTTEQAEAS